jgi:hypothetical protein
MSKTNTFENQLLLHIFNNGNVANIGDATGLRGSTAPGSLYVSLHTADPGEAGDQQSNEIAYTGYARVAVPRAGANWAVANNSVTPVANVEFPAGTGGSGTATHFGIGTSPTGAGTLMYKGAINPNIVTGDGVTPRLTTATAVTED